MATRIRQANQGGGGTETVLNLAKPEPDKNPNAFASKPDTDKEALSAENMDILTDALIFEIRHGGIKNVNYRLSEGADPNRTDKEGILPMAAAVCVNKINVCRLLLKKGADVDGKDRRGWTALMYAAWANNAMMCRFLLGHGADALIMDKEKNSTYGLPNEKETKALLKMFAWKSKALKSLLSGRIGAFKEHFGLCVS
jgi:ankyrin repeat protein